MQPRERSRAATTSASALIDIYRDFDEEGDETIAVALGTLTGDARMGDDNSFTLTVIDGETAAGDRTAIEGPDPDTALIPFGFRVTGESVELAIAAVNYSPGGGTVDLVALFEMGTSELRGGLGAIYVKAAGNEFSLCDRLHPLSGEIGYISSNAGPMQNLPYLIAVGAFNVDGVKSSYSSAGANLWVVAPGGEDGLVDGPAIVTTDQSGTGAGYGLFGGNGLTPAHPSNREGDYMGDFGGTSSASPLVAGAAAVLLGVNPDLTWRDVKHILAASARRIDPVRAQVRAAFSGQPDIARHAWQTNAAGYPFHNWYGFGAVDLDAAVARAMSQSPDSLGDFVESEWYGQDEELSLAIPAADGAGVSATMEVTGLPDSANLEAVILEISVEHRDALGLGVTLRSPAGTPSILNPPFNGILDGYPGLHDWRLMSNAFYGEQPNGAWTVQVVDLAGGATGTLKAWRLRFYYGEHP